MEYNFFPATHDAQSWAERVLNAHFLNPHLGLFYKTSLVCKKQEQLETTTTVSMMQRFTLPLPIVLTQKAKSRPGKNRISIQLVHASLG